MLRAVSEVIPTLDLGRDYDQRYARADFHCDEHGRLSAFFGRSVPVHRHDRYFQIHCIFNGAVHVYLDDQPYHMQAPLCIFTPPGVPHAFVSDADSEGLALTVYQHRVWSLADAEPEFSTWLSQPQCLALSTSTQSGWLMECFKQFHMEFQQQGAGRDANLHALLRLIIVTLLRMAQDGAHASPYAVLHADLQRFHQFSQLVEQYCRENWPLQRYADALHLTTARLTLICRRLGGMSPKQMIAERQLQEAKRLLLHSGCNVSQIAFSLGFQDAAYFSRFFTTRVGLSPTQYRAAQSQFHTTLALRKVQV